MIAEPPIPDPVTPAAEATRPAPGADATATRTQGLQSLGSPDRPTPAISPSDRTLLFAYFESHDNLAALATTTGPTTGQDYFDLLTWLNQPHIQSALEAHDQAVARNDRRRALEALRQSLDTADNPTNLRRAATTLLRSTIVRTSPPPPPRNGSSPPSPRGTRGEVCGGPSEGKSTDGEGRARVRTDSLLPLAPLPPLPPPTSRPTPNSTPQSAFAHIKAALIAPQLPVALSTLHAHATPTATFAGHPIPPDPTTWPDSLPSTLPKDFSLPLNLILEPTEVERTDTPAGAISRWSLWARARGTGSFDCAVTLIRDGPDHPNSQSRRGDPSWRLASFDILRRSG